MKQIYYSLQLLVPMLFSINVAFAQTIQLHPETVTPGNSKNPPSDAIIIFDGNSLNAFESVNGGAAL